MFRREKKGYKKNRIARRVNARAQPLALSLTHTNEKKKKKKKNKKRALSFLLKYNAEL